MQSSQVSEMRLTNPELLCECEKNIPECYTVGIGRFKGGIQ